MSSARRLIPAIALVAVLVALGLAAVAPAAASVSAPSAPAFPGARTVSSGGAQAAPAVAAATVGPLRIDLYRRGDFVSQTNLVQCVGASMQMMLNMMRVTDDRTASTQQSLFELARSLRDPSVPSNPGWRGASAAGWASGLTVRGGGPYAVRSAGTLDEALTLAAAAIVRTGRPAGLLMWQGAHAWVMSGFEATADPSLDPAAHVTAVRVLDPLYPRPVGGAWGPGPAPDARLTVAQLGRAFVPYRPHSRNLVLRNRYVLVLPLEHTRTASFRSLAV